MSTITVASAQPATRPRADGTDETRPGDKGIDADPAKPWTSTPLRPARDTRAPRVTFAISLCCCGNPGGSSLFGVRLKERRFVGCTYPLATAEGAQDEGTLTFDSHGAAVCNAS